MLGFNPASLDLADLAPTRGHVEDSKSDIVLNATDATPGKGCGATGRNLLFPGRGGRRAFNPLAVALTRKSDYYGRDKESK